MKLKHAFIFLLLLGTLIVKGQTTDSTNHLVVENMPIYGNNIFYDLKKEVAKCFIYSQYAYNKDLQGRVFVRFSVDVNKKKGDRIYDIFVLRGVDISLDFTAILIIEMLPDKWKPASCRGKDKPVTLTVPIDFKDKNLKPVNKTTILDKAIVQIEQMDSITQRNLLYDKSNDTTQKKLATYFEIESQLQDFIRNKAKD